METSLGRLADARPGRRRRRRQRRARCSTTRLVASSTRARRSSWEQVSSHSAALTSRRTRPRSPSRLCGGPRQTVACRAAQAADAVYAVASASWTYRDQGAVVAAAVGASPQVTVQSARFGGDAGQVLINTAGEAIASGEASVVLVCGAEAGATLASTPETAGLAVAEPRGEADQGHRQRARGQQRRRVQGRADGAYLRLRPDGVGPASQAGRVGREHRARIATLWSDSLRSRRATSTPGCRKRSTRRS